RRDARRRGGQDYVRHERDQFHRISTKVIGVTRCPSHVDVDVAADCPTCLLQTLQKNSDAALPLRIVRGQMHEHADPSHPVGLLRAHPERPYPRAAEQRDERAPFHVWMAPAWQEKM